MRGLLDRRTYQIPDSNYISYLDLIPESAFMIKTVDAWIAMAESYGITLRHYENYENARKAIEIINSDLYKALE